MTKGDGMMLKSRNSTSWTQDRFMMFFVLATSLHALLFFGVNFGVVLNPVAPKRVDGAILVDERDLHLHLSIRSLQRHPHVLG